MRIFLLLSFTILLAACNPSQDSADSSTIASTSEVTNEVVLKSEIEWAPLNPARGAKGPKAANLWGDRTQAGPTGFLVQFVDGFSSPPHIHNVTYRGMVISGLLHNDDPQAERMWLPPGSFWTQPAGEVHITAARGNYNLAYIEIDEGPYLVQPIEEASDNGERPINVDPSNLVWLDASDLTRINAPKKLATVTHPQMAFLWGNPSGKQLHGTLLKLPADFFGQIHSSGSTFRAVVIAGDLQYQFPEAADSKVLESGSYFGSTGESVHKISTSSGETLIYIRSNDGYVIE